MKKSILLVVLVVVISLPAFTQGFYFDGGIGVGWATTKLDGTDITSAMGSDVQDLGVDLSLKFGYGPIGIPLYVVGEISGIGHRLDDGIDYLQFNSYLIGPGVIFYPVPALQLATSFGYSFTGNQTSLPLTLYKSDIGWSFNVSAAWDFGRNRSGGLLGVKYTYASNTLEVSGAKQESSLISIFLKYAFRHKGTTEKRDW